MTIPKVIINTEEDATDQLTMNLGFAYNLAPIIGTSQTFLDLELGYGIPVIEEEGDLKDITPYTASAYIGLSRKFWFNRMALHANVMAGYDQFSMDYMYFLDDYTLSINAWGLKAGCDLNMMLTPDLKLTAGVDYKLGLMPTGVTLEKNDETLYDGQGDLESPYDDIRLGGLMLRAGFSYSLGELPINLFGWLDPLKRY